MKFTTFKFGVKLQEGLDMMGFIDATPGFQFQWVFTQVGSTQYICDPHPNSMFGTITVTD